ncbi:MAG: hypothetical protein ACRD1V_17850 [Vicinamibacterales bacterium]
MLHLLHALVMVPVLITAVVVLLVLISLGWLMGADDDDYGGDR